MTARERTASPRAALQGGGVDTGEGRLLASPNAAGIVAASAQAQGARTTADLSTTGHAVDEAAPKADSPGATLQSAEKAAAVQAADATRPALTLPRPARSQRARLATLLIVATALLAVAGLVSGVEGWHIDVLRDPMLRSVLLDIRAPRTIGAWLTGALLGLAGALAQGLFRNPLADPYLLGSSAGAGLGVVLVLAAGAAGGHAVAWFASDLLSRIGLVGAAFGGALLGVALTLTLARGAQQSTQLLLAGVVVGVVLGAIADLVTMASPEALRGKQVFMLGTTGYLGWASCGTLAIALAVTLPLAWRFSRALDALTLGEDSARSLGLPLGQVRALLVVLLALATGAAVAQAGLIAFVGLVAPHLVRRRLQAPHGVTLLASSAMGGVLLLASDVLSRSLVAPQELPVGVLTAAVGGCFLLWLMHRRRAA